MTPPPRRSPTRGSRPRRARRPDRRPGGPTRREVRGAPAGDHGGRLGAVALRRRQTAGGAGVGAERSPRRSRGRPSAGLTVDELPCRSRSTRSSRCSPPGVLMLYLVALRPARCLRTTSASPRRAFAYLGGRCLRWATCRWTPLPRHGPRTAALRERIAAWPHRDDRRCSATDAVGCRRLVRAGRHRRQRGRARWSRSPYVRGCAAWACVPGMAWCWWWMQREIADRCSSPPGTMMLRGSTSGSGSAARHGPKRGRKITAAGWTQCEHVS